MERKIRSRFSIIKRDSKTKDNDNNYITKISIKKLYEIFKESPEDFAIIKSLIKLNNISNNKTSDHERKNELISSILENMKKKNLFFFFLNFYKINDDLLKKIIPHLKYEHCQKGAHIYNENDFSFKFYFLIKGSISFHKNEIVIDSQKNTAIIDVEKFVLGPDKYFGEIDLIYDKKKSMSAFCKTECHLITISKEKFKKYLEEKISKIELEKKFFIFNFFKKFSRIPSIRLEKYLLNNVQTLFFRRNKIIYNEGENNNSLYLIFRGEAVIINDIKKGEFSYLKNFNERIKYIQKKAIGLNYIEIINNTKIKNKEEIKNDKELSELNLLMDKMKYDIICNMTKGGIGGLEIVSGINKFKYSLIANSDFTCVLKLELKNIDDYLTEFLINLIPLFVQMEKNIHERIKNMKLIDENITPSSVKKLKKNKKYFFYDKKEGEENDKIYKKNIQKIDDSFQLNYGGFIKNNKFNFNLYQKKQHLKELLKSNKKKIFEIEKFLKYLADEEKLNLKFIEFKMNKNPENKNKNNTISHSSSKSIKNNNQNIRRLFSTKSIYNNLKLTLDSNNTDIKKNTIQKFKKSKLTWKFVNTDTRKLKIKEENKNELNINFFSPKKEEEKNKKKNYNNIFDEKRSLSIDDDYKQKVYICSSPKNKIINRYKAKELLFITPKKNKSFNIYNMGQKQKQFLKKNHIRVLKKVFLYDTGKFDIPLLSEE